MNNDNSRVKSFLFNLVWLIIVAALALAFIKVNDINDVATGVKFFRYKSKEVQACFDDNVTDDSVIGVFRCNLGLRVIVPGVSPDSVTDNDGDDSILEDLGLDKIGQLADGIECKLSGLNNTTVDDIQIKLDNIQGVNELEKVNYTRTDWPHWSVYDDSQKCWSIREEVLYRQAEPGTIIFLDRDKNVTEDKSDACYIGSGLWNDPWSDAILTSPSEVDIDHHIPLALVAQSGGENFSTEQREQYANDLDLLIATSAKQNRSKGASGPSDWMPPDENSHCSYAKIYVFVLDKYNLRITQADKEALEKALATCPANY